jgi:site-specific DNA recombinase
MIIADLYVRVSTDDQAEKGYSQRDQEERMRRYCSGNSITVGQVYYEDHSAKNFNRPQWVFLLSNLKKRTSKSNLVLFTKWDRFSRNAGDAYQMISTLRKLGVEPQAIEQPLDLSIPENKMMLAIYLSTPEVENDRRALNTFLCMRRAKKEGRLMGKAAYGYINKHTEKGIKYIDVKEPEASAMKWAFNEISKGILVLNDIRKKMNKKGGRIISSSTFHELIRNPLYYGKVFIPKYANESAQLVQGLHEPLISESLFDKVQIVLDGRRNLPRPNVKILSESNLPLRGFLLCPECGSTLTGSASKGRTNRYYYYHCRTPCGHRQKAEVANDFFEDAMMQLQLNEPMKKFVTKLFLDNYKKFVKYPVNQKKKLSDEIDVHSQRLSVARNKLLSGVIDDDDYLQIKAECKEKINDLELLLSKDDSESKIVNIDNLVKEALKSIVNIGKVYKEGEIETKRSIVGSIFPEKIAFDGKQCRTARMNVVAKYIFQSFSTLCDKKNRKNEINFHFSGLVPRAGVEPAHLAILVFETNASTNSAIWACPLMGVQK